MLEAKRQLLNIKASTKKEAIEELVTHAVKASDQIFDEHQALQVLGEREQLASTGIGMNVGIPHCRLIGIEKPVLVFGTHKEGLDFNAIDNQPCKIFLLMLTSAGDPGQHLKLLSEAALLLSDENKRKALINSDSIEEFMNIIV